MNKELTELVIDREKWGTSALLRADGRMCCLGFYAKAAGADDQELGPNNVSVGNSKGTPACWPELKPYYPSWIADRLDKDYFDTEDLIFTNDTSTLTSGQKEARIIEIFAKHGVKVTFVGPEGSGPRP